MKIFPSNIVRDIDAFTIKNEPVSSTDLMERAALTLFNYIAQIYPKNGDVVVFCGPGNNGGDGLALARMLHLGGYRVVTYLVADIAKLSEDCRINYERLHIIDQQNIHLIKSRVDFPVIKDVLILDALFGSGLSRPLDGIYKELVERINEANVTVLAIDIPSGLFAENNHLNPRKSVIKASKTIAFQFPKLAFLLADNALNVGEWRITDIGLHPKIIAESNTSYQLLDSTFIKGIFRKRERFSHKGTFGHALLLVGSYCKMGAAVLASKGCLKSGVGLVTTHTPHIGYQILQTAVPEAMVCVDRSDILISEFPNLEMFKAIGVGPGIGTKSNTREMLFDLLQKSTQPLVLDADALNILSEYPEKFKMLPKASILTPHPGEFARMSGPFKDDFDQLQKAISFAKKYEIILVLKGAYTAILDELGMCLFNSTGNSGMATAGSGDVLTGIITGLLAQGYTSKEAAILGVWVHGLAGDIYIQTNGEEALTASDILDNMGKAYSELRKYK